MTNLTQKEMIQTILGDVQEVMVRQGTMEKKLDNIEIDLGGTEREPERGVIPRLQKAERCIGEIKKKQYRILTWGVVIITSANLLFVAIKSFIILLKSGGG